MLSLGECSVVIEKIYIFCFVGWNVPYVSARCCWLIVFRTSIPLLIFCLVVLSFAEIGVFMPPTLTADLSVSPFKKTYLFLFFFWGFVVWRVHIQDHSLIHFYVSNTVSTCNKGFQQILPE